MNTAGWESSGWKWVDVNLSCVPKQPNITDCGLYVCLMANILSRGYGLNDINVNFGSWYRNRMAIAMVENTLE